MKERNQILLFILPPSALILPESGDEEQEYRIYRRMPAGLPQSKLSPLPSPGSLSLSTKPVSNCRYKRKGSGVPKLSINSAKRLTLIEAGWIAFIDSTNFPILTN
jgi:hypothetical protein